MTGDEKDFLAPMRSEVTPVKSSTIGASIGIVVVVALVTDCWGGIQDSDFA